MNHATLRKIAAATAVICEQNGGSVTRFFLLKALYLADRQMIVEYGAPITGDKYSSMPKGPVLQGTYSLLKGGNSLGDSQTQAEWDAAFVQNGNDVSVRAGVIVDTDCLSPIEEEILREKITLVMELDKNKVNVADWMHKNCPEWEEVVEGHSKPISLSEILIEGRKISEVEAKPTVEAVANGLKIRALSAFASAPVVRHA